jgi:hypothetical protein
VFINIVPVLQAIETHDLQEILAGIDKYLQRLVLQPYYHVLQETRCQARQTALLSYFKNKSEEPPIDPKTAVMIQSTLTIHSQGIPLVSNAYIFILLLQNICDINPGI